MKSEWKEVRLEEITSMLGDGLHGTPIYDDDGDYYFINGNNIRNGGVDIDSKTKKVSYEEFLKYKKNLNNRTLLVSINGTLGNVGLYNGEKVCLGKSACYFNVNEDVDKHFVKYILSSKYFQNYLYLYSTGTTIKNMSLKSMRDFKFKLPDNGTQKKIAHILSTLDDKIELNHKMNQTLEEMAQALFKSWFVDFDPVHAKANASSDSDYDRIAKELGISREVLDLFPDEFEESELGMIPKGWKVTKLGGCDFAIESGKRPKGGIDKELKDGFPSVGAESISPVGTFDYSKEKNVTNSFAKTIKSGKIHNFDVVLYKDGARLSDSERLNDKLSIYGEGFPYKEFFINEHIYILRSKELGQFFLYCLMTSKNSISHLVNCATGKAAQPGLNQTEVKDLKFVYPRSALIDTFNNLVSPIVKKQLNNGSNNKDLSKLRDLLLPKLLSGELEVSELELDNATH